MKQYLLSEGNMVIKYNQNNQGRIQDFELGGAPIFSDSDKRAPKA